MCEMNQQSKDKHMEALTRMPFTAQKKILKRLAELSDSRSLSKEEQGTQPPLPLATVPKGGANHA